MESEGNKVQRGWARAVPRRAFMTISSGLGPSNANGLLEPSELKSSALDLEERFFFPKEDKEVGCTDSSLFLLPSALLSPSLRLSSEGEDIRRSSTSMEANAEGDARERVALGANIGEVSKISISEVSSTWPESRKGFSCAFLIFIASLDFLGSEDEELLTDSRGELRGVGGKAGTTALGDCKL